MLGDILIILYCLLADYILKKELMETDSAVKWSCPNIHDLINILDRIKLQNILDEECDRRLSDIHHLNVVQLREECFVSEFIEQRS